MMMQWIKRMNFLLKIFNNYLEFEKSLLEFRAITNRQRKLSKTDLQKIANRYVMMGYSLDFLDEPKVDKNGSE